MLCTANSGKLLSKRYATDLEQCMRNKDLYTPAQQEYLELPPGAGYGDYKEMSLRLDTQPIDPQTPPRKNMVDVRSLNGF